MNSNKFIVRIQTKERVKMKKCLAFGIAIIMLGSALLTFSNGNEVKAETKSGYTSHSPIYIDGNSEFTSANGVVSGNGSQGNPYIIGGWDIDASTQNGIDIENTDKYFVIRNCYVHDGFSDDGDYENDYDGIHFNNVQNGKIENCEIKNNGDGTSINFSNNNQITNNSIYNCDLGIGILLSSNNNQITNNRVYGNIYRGISIFNSEDNEITNNIFYDNRGYSIYFWFSYNNRMTNNSDYDNDYGIFLQYSSNNKIYLNDFINNINQAYDDGNNIWNSTDKGNYWSDYNGTDSNSDGIGNTPYNISGGINKDNYPLMKTTNQKPNSVILSYSKITINSINLFWTKNNNLDFKNYTIFISENNMTWKFLTSISDIDTTSYNATNLTQNTTYYLKIRIFDLGNLYNDSNIISVKTLQIPNSVSLSSSSITSNSIKLSWSKTNISNFANYTIYQSSISGQLGNPIKVILDKDTTSFTVSNLNSNTTYYFKIRVYNSLGLFNDSNPISAKTTSETTQNQNSETKNELPILYIVVGVIIISIAVLGIFLIKRKPKQPQYVQQPMPQYPQQQYQPRQPNQDDFIEENDEFIEKK